mgnify:CR=1 FL=1
MKIKEKIQEIINISEKDIDKFLALTSLGTMLNLIEEGFEELNDKEILSKFKEVINLIEDKREEILDKDILEDLKDEWRI